MADLILFLMTIASAVSLFIVSPRKTQKTFIRALTENADTVSSPIGDQGDTSAETI